LVCPSQIPLVSYYQQAKTAVELDERQQERAQQAALRHRQHERRLAQPAPPRQQAMEMVPMAAPPVDKQAAIQDALQRVRARKAQRSTPNSAPLDAAAVEDDQDADGR
jgi:electron transport complex protein RnfC